MLVRHPPVVFVDGGTLSPRDLNANLGALAQTIEDVSSKRYVHFQLRLPFFRDLSTPYTENDLGDVRSFLLRFPVPLSLERRYLRWYGSTDGGPARVHLRHKGVTDVVEPFEVPDSEGTDVALQLFSGSRVLLAADTEYVVSLDDDGAVTSRASYLDLHFRADVWGASGSDEAPELDPPRLSSADARDATVITSALGAVDEATKALEDGRVFSRAEVYALHDLANGDKIGWALPYVDAARTSRHLVGAMVVLALDAPAGTGGVAAELRIGGSGWGASVLVTVPQGQTSAVASKVLDEHLSAAGADHSDPAGDGYVQVASLATTSIAKAQVLLFYA